VKFFSLFALILTALLSFSFIGIGAAQAYPEFISYSYTTCITCHYNPQGNGPLNDYGRALFSAEIAARDIFPTKMSDEEIASGSGFLGSTPLPSWLRPGYSYRGLWFQTNPGSSATVKRWITMQNEFNTAIQFDADQKYVFVGSIEDVSLSTSSSGYPNDAWISREHYFRWQFKENWFLSVGMMEKVFGIRIIDHTAYAIQNLNLDSHTSVLGTLTHAATLYWSEPNRDIAVQLFIGNVNESEPSPASDQQIRQKGGSIMTEFNTGENSRTGGSFLMSSNLSTRMQRVAAHQRMGISHGSALLAEAGFLQNQDISQGNGITTAFFGFAQATALIRRGYNLLSLAEYYRSPQGQANDQFRWGMGIVAFPMPRLEIRFTVRDARTWSPNNGVPDSWDMQAQLHLAL
jgi:hypothetical protein